MTQMYLWQNKKWPMFVWQDAAFATLLTEVNMLRKQLLDSLLMLGMKEQNASMLEALTQEIVRSSEIEGEILNTDSVCSSVAKQLGLEYDGLPKENHYIEGVVQVMLDATQ